MYANEIILQSSIAYGLQIVWCLL